MKIEWIKEQKNKIIQLLCLISVPAAAFYLMECYTHNPLSEVRTWAQLFNVILFELIAWILYFSGWKSAYGVAHRTCNCDGVRAFQRVCGALSDEPDRAVGSLFLENGGECGIEL